MIIITREEIKNKIILLLKSTKREGIDNFLNKLEKTDFFDAPASTKFHLSKKGGLAEHSLNVYNEFSKLCKNKGLKLTDSCIIITSLLHDICKIDTYFVNTLKKGNVSTAKPFFYYDKYPLGHGEKSIILILENGLVLRKKEKMMIRWHMGPFDRNYINNQQSIVKHAKEAQYLFIADFLATLGEE